MSEDQASNHAGNCEIDFLVGLKVSAHSIKEAKEKFLAMPKAYDYIETISEVEIDNLTKPHIDAPLAGDALIKLGSVIDLLRMTEDGDDKEDLKIPLVILLNDIYWQFGDSGVEAEQASCLPPRGRK